MGQKEQEQKFKKIARAFVLGSAAVTFAAVGCEGESNQSGANQVQPEVGNEKLLDSNQSDEIYSQIVFQNQFQNAKKIPDIVIGKVNINVAPKIIEELIIIKTPTQTQDQGVAKPPEKVFPQTVEVQKAEIPAIEKYKSELPAVLEIAKTYPDKFKVSVEENPDLEALSMYYPVYRAAQDRFGIPWQLLYIMHGEESGYSIDPRAYQIISDQYGPMQRNIDFHPESRLTKYIVGLEYLANLPLRHPEDAKELIYGAAIMKENFDQTGDWLSALKLYSAAVHAENRYRKYIEMSTLFE